MTSVSNEFLIISGFIGIKSSSLKLGSSNLNFIFFKFLQHFNIYSRRRLCLRDLKESMNNSLVYSS